MFEKKLLDLVIGLRKKTGDRKVDWKPSYLNDEVFEAEFHPYKVSITSRHDPDYPDEPDYIVQILNNANKVVEEFSNATLRGFMEEGKVNPYKMLEETYTLARRQALGADDAVESLLDDLTKE